MYILAIFGTRPEAIKMCPLIKELQSRENITCRVCLTGQHRDMVKPILKYFGISKDFDFDIMKTEQTLTSITCSVLGRLEAILDSEKPDIVLVHGDTTTAFAAALAAFYKKIPVGHVEAGLRTYCKYSPFPEEMNRTLISRLCTYHFVPTNKNQKNLMAERILCGVYVTGNTVLDAFKYTIKDNYKFENTDLLKIDFEHKKVILLTAHRRENLGEGIINICKAVKMLAEEREDVLFVYPVHPNPAVRQVVYPLLGSLERVKLIEPLELLDMHNLLAKIYLVMTDSGGLQEEAPALGKPVLVLRKDTERPEAVEAGTAKLVGVQVEDILRETRSLLTEKTVYDSMAKAINPYGDGNASKYIADILSEIGISGGE